MRTPQPVHTGRLLFISILLLVPVGIASARLLSLSSPAPGAAVHLGERRTASLKAPPALSHPAIPVQGPGVAPTGDPGTGFDIEGDLLSNNPTANTTDWVAGSAGTGIGVLTNAGIAIDPTTTVHRLDLYDSMMDDVFTSGSKVNDDPNTWSWTLKKPSAKDDIHNGLMHFSGFVARILSPCANRPVSQ